MERPVDAVSDTDSKDIAYSRDKLHAAQRDHKSLTSTLSELKDDRLVKFFGSDGLLHLLRNICKQLHNSDNISSKKLCKKYKSTGFYNKLFVNQEVFVYPENYIFSDEIFLSLLKSAETFIKDISADSTIFIPGNNLILKKLTGIITEIKILEKNISDYADEQIRSAGISFSPKYTVPETLQESGTVFA